MSRKIVEDIHYYYSKTAKKFKAWDIIDTGKDISVLHQDENGSLQTHIIKDKKLFRKKLEELNNVA